MRTACVPCSLPRMEKQPLLPAAAPTTSRYVLVIHGGAGTMNREKSSAAQRKAYHDGLRVALEAGHKVLREGGEAMDASVAAVSALEGDHLPLEQLLRATNVKTDNILFNSGKGAVFNTAGKVN